MTERCCNFCLSAWTIVFLCGCAGWRTGTPRVESIESAIPLGYAILELDSADVNGDDCLDYLMALKKIDEASEELRPLILLTSTRSCRGFKQQWRNNRALYAFETGPYAGFESFAGMEFERDTVKLHYYAGMSTRWAESHVFVYDEPAKTYLLSYVFISVDRIYDDEEPEDEWLDYSKERMALDTIDILRYW